MGANILALNMDTFIMNVVTFSGYYPKAVLFETHQSGAKMIKEYQSYVILDKLERGILGVEIGIMYRFKDNVRIYKIINDTIFTIGPNTEMNDSFVFKLGKYKPTLSFIERKEDNIRDAYKKYIIPKSIYESINHLFIKFDFGNYAP